MAKKAVKLSFKDQREYDALPALIESLESELETLAEKVGSSEFYQNENEIVQATLKQLEDKEGELEGAFERWEVLESLVMGDA